MSTVTIRILVDDWAVRSLSFGPFNTREEANASAQHLYDFIHSASLRADPRSAEPADKSDGKDTCG